MSVQKGRILIVDDEQGIRDLLTSEFSRLGYDTASAVNGEEAVSMLQNEKVDVVITDMKMPGVDGLELLKFVKEKNPETEVIIITGYATVDNALDAMRGGVYDFVQKPFNIDELVTLAEKALEKTELKMLVALYESGNAIFSSLNQEELFPLMSSLVKKATYSNDVSVFLLDENDVLYQAYSTYDESVRQKKEVELIVSKLHEIKKNEPLFFDINNVPAELEEIFNPASKINSVIIHPIILNKKMMGYLVLTKTSAKLSFVRADLKNAGVFAALMAQSITNIALYEKLEDKISELEKTSNDLSKLKDFAKLPVAKMQDTALFISGKADYISSIKNIPQEAVVAINEIKSKALQCLKEIQAEKK